MSASDPQVSPTDGHPTATGQLRAGVVLAAIGIVFGDIGTSPLYALRAGFLLPGEQSVSADAVSEPLVLGLISTFFWTLMLVISVKYMLFILRADNRGEGGIFALLSLLPNRQERNVFGLPMRWFILGVVGASLLYADGLITPAISVLSALEGLKELQPVDQRSQPLFSTNLIMLMALVLLGALFVIQRKGTAFIGIFFGPIMLLWFLSLGVLGAISIVQTPQILAALNPIHIVSALQGSFTAAITVVGAVMLCITGGEALYADLGHFGRKPIGAGWYLIVMPGLVLNYLGQGALLLRDPSAIVNPFYQLVPEWGIGPMVLLASAAAIIASQAMITGIFSLTHAAIQLGMIPRLRVIHTSEHGLQVYVPLMNAISLVLVCLIVLIFESSERLAYAYGLAVALNMGLVSLLFAVLMHRHHGWGFARLLTFIGIFCTIDLAFIIANVFKIPHGGWLTLLIAATTCYIIFTWIRGRRVMIERYARQTLDFTHLVNSLQTHPLPRVAGTAVFLTQQQTGVPPTLLHHMKHNKVLHEKVVIMTVQTAVVPFVDPEDQVEVTEKTDGFWTVNAKNGFLQSADVPRLMRLASEQGLETHEGSTTYFLGRTILSPRGRSSMPGFQKRLFCTLGQISSSNPLYFSIPPGRMIELGVQVDI
jgi:KUP system potassium uptake protein